MRNRAPICPEDQLGALVEAYAGHDAERMLSLGHLAAC